MSGYRLAELRGLTDQWFVVAEAADVTAPRAVQVLGESFVVWPSGDGGIRGAVDRCPHREAPLSAGCVADQRLVCAYHGWAFADDGACVSIPSSGVDAPIPRSARLDTVSVVERYGLVWLSPGLPSSPPPEIPEDRDPTFRRINAGIETWAASTTRMVDNFCDVAHFPYVHAATLGRDLDPFVDHVSVEALDADFVGYRYSVAVDGASGERIEQAMSTGFALPFTVRSTTQFLSGPDAGTERILVLCSTPVDDSTSLFTFVVWRNVDDGTPDEEQIAFDRRIGAEDRAMLEQLRGHLPLDIQDTVSVQADRLSVEWRRRLAALR